MGKEVGMLENDADSALFRFTVDIAAAVKKDVAVEADVAPVRSAKAGQQMHECGFSAAGWPEDPCPAGGERKIALQPEISDSF